MFNDTYTEMEVHIVRTVNLMNLNEDSKMHQLCDIDVGT